MRNLRSAGFTLLELMIVVAVIAILAMIAFPNYTEQVRKGRRADAARTVGQIQLDLERWRAECSTYADVLACKDHDGDGTVEAGEGVYPATPSSEYYTITPSALTATTYTITAAPKSGSAQAGDRCGNLVLTVAQPPVNDSKPTWVTASCN